MKNQSIIKKNYEFQKIISYKKTKKSKTIIIYYIKNNLGYLRYGISVGKKIGNAVVRNKIKRKVRSQVYFLLDKYKTKTFDIIIIVRMEYLNRSYDYSLTELKAVLDTL